MKKIFLIAFWATLISFNANSAKLKSKHIVGAWSFTIEMEQRNNSGIFKLNKNKKQLDGEIRDESGKEYKLSNISIRNNKLIFEFQPNEHTLVCELKLNNNKLEGELYISNANGSFKIIAEKIE